MTKAQKDAIFNQRGTHSLEEQAKLEGQFLDEIYRGDQMAESMIAESRRRGGTDEQIAKFLICEY
jgi:hypothetical protein